MSLHEFPDIDQGTPEWHDIRRGIVTASTVGQLLTIDTLSGEAYECPTCLAQPDNPCKSLARGKVGTPLKMLHKERTTAANKAGVLDVRAARNDTSRRLTLTLVAERVTGETEHVFMNDDMLRGHLEEPIARDMYAEHFADEPVTTTGFQIRDDWGFQIGASPDGLVGEWGGLEVKAPRAKAHIATTLSGEVPLHHLAQIQACLLVSGREWWDFCSYYGGLPPFVKRVYADPKWAEAIVDAVSAFEQRAEEMTHRYDLATRGMPATERRIPVEMNTVELNIS